jgi:hypothetical protein
MLLPVNNWWAKFIKIPRLGDAQDCCVAVALPAYRNECLTDLLTLHESRLAACKEFISKGRYLFFNLPPLARTSIHSDAHQLRSATGSFASSYAVEIVAQSIMTFGLRP